MNQVSKFVGRTLTLLLLLYIVLSPVTATVLALWFVTGFKVDKINNLPLWYWILQPGYIVLALLSFLIGNYLSKKPKLVFLESLRYGLIMTFGIGIWRTSLDVFKYKIHFLTQIEFYLILGLIFSIIHFLFKKFKNEGIDHNDNVEGRRL